VSLTAARHRFGWDAIKHEKIPDPRVVEQIGPALALRSISRRQSPR
jgi:hypothetical protein